MLIQLQRLIIVFKLPSVKNVGQTGRNMIKQIKIRVRKVVLRNI